MPRGAPQVLSPDQGSIGGGDGLVDSGGARGRPTDVRACFENEEPPIERLRLPPRRGWLRDLPAKGPHPQHGVYIGRSYGAFYQPQGWENPFKPDPRKGNQGLQEVVDAYEQHLCQSRGLVDRLPELSGKVLYCHCKPTDPADALLRAWEQNVDGSPRTVAPGVGRMLKKSLARLVEKDKLSLIGVGFEIKDLVEMDLHCIASVLSTVPLATLDHLRCGAVLRCILPLPQPASVSEAEITLRNLIETTQNFDHVQHLWKEGRAESLGMVGCGRRQLHVPARWPAHAEWKSTAFPSSTAGSHGQNRTICQLVLEKRSQSRR